MIWRFTYIYWCSVVKQTAYVKADTESEAYKEFDKHFGYEEVDIKDVEQVSVEETLKEFVWGY